MSQELVVQTPETKLVALVNDANLPQSKAEELLNEFTSIFKAVANWERMAQTIVVENEKDVEAMKMARTARLDLRQRRISVEKRHKELKSTLLSQGRVIDGIKNTLIGLIEPLEKSMQEKEDFVKIKQEREYKEFLEKKRLEQEARELEERLAREKAEQEQREKERKEAEKIRLENLRLQQERDELMRKQELERKAAAEKERAIKIEAERVANELRLKVEAEKEAVRKKAEFAMLEQRKKDEEKRQQDLKIAREKMIAEQIKRDAEAAEKLAIEKAKAAKQKEEMELAAKKQREEADKKAEEMRVSKAKFDEIIKHGIVCPNCNHTVKI